ncbi:ketosteroid isomerase-like protein [Bradyrhizobium huanghuaihaiense]
MTTTAMLRVFCDAVEQRNGRAFAELFTEDGVYHDVFYGAFAGREKIAAMIDDWFYRTATDFRWDMHDPVTDGTTLYARYTFSYRSTLPDANGARAMFEGVAIMTLRDGRIACYHEVANTAAGVRRPEVRAGANCQDRRQAGCRIEGAAGDEAASGVGSLPSFRGAPLGASPESIGPQSRR